MEILVGGTLLGVACAVILLFMLNRWRSGNRCAMRCRRCGGHYKSGAGFVHKQWCRK